MPKRGRTIATYDESARKEWLTGFHKRKVARRKEAEAHKKELEAEERREARAARKREEAEAMAHLQVETYEVPVTAAAADAEAGVQRAEVSDDFSKRRFGAETVVVTTSFGTLSDVEEADDDVLREMAARAPARRGRKDGHREGGAVGGDGGATGKKRIVRAHGGKRR